MAANTNKSTAPKPAATGNAQKESANSDVDEQQRLRGDLTAAVKAIFRKQESDPRTRFHEQFRKEAEDYDQDFHKKYHDDLNSTLIFAGLFSAVASAFILDVQSQIRPDYGQMSFTVLTMLVNTTSGKPTQVPLPTWSGPTRSNVQVQSILFASLLSALLAAFLAMLGKQWLNLHIEGSFIDRNHYREQKMRGMISWRFKLVMECLPLIMQTSLLLLGYALAQYLQDISHTVSSVIAAFTALGVVGYLFIVAVGTFSKACPFQTPVSIVLRAILEHHRKDIKKVFKAAGNLFHFSQPQARLPTHQQPRTPSIIPDICDQDTEIRAELGCILTMFKMTKASDSIKAIMAYITEIVWDERLKPIPLLQVYQTLRESLLGSVDGRVYPRQGARDRAFWSAKALLHLYNQRRCIHPRDTALPDHVKSIDHRSKPLGHNGFGNDFDLQSTFYIVDWTFGLQPEIPWGDLHLSEPHRCWLGHILQYRAFDVLYGMQKALTDDVEGFVVESLGRCDSPARVIADCLFIALMVAGHKPKPRDLLNKDRSHEIPKIIDDIFDRLDKTFEKSDPSSPATQSAIKALGLAIRFRDRRVCSRSYSLFKIIMERVTNNEELWSSARDCFRGAYNADTTIIPKVGDPKQLLRFLDYHMENRARTGSRPISNIFTALVIASDQQTDLALAAYDFTNPLFIDTMTEALENVGHTHLRKFAIFLLPKLDNHLFTTEEAFKDQDKASRFVVAWSSATHVFLGDPTPTIERAVVKVLLAIAHLPCLRKHLPTDRWSLLRHSSHVMLTKPPPFQRCLGDPTILPYLNKILDARKPSPWFGTLWLMYQDLSQEVREQLEEETRRTAAGAHNHLLQSYLRMFDLQIGNLDVQIADLDPLDQAASDRQVKRKLVVEARRKLFSLTNRSSGLFS